MGDKRKSGHFQYDWDTFDDQYDKALDEDKIFHQFSKFSVDLAKKHSRTVEPLVPTEVWEDPNLSYSLRKYLQFCEQDSKIIIVQKPKKIQSLTTSKKANDKIKLNNNESETNSNTNKRKSASSITSPDQEQQMDILPLIKLLQNSSRPDVHLLHYESAVDPTSDIEANDFIYQSDTIYHEESNSKRTQVSLKHFREVSLSAMALPLPVNNANNSSTIRKAEADPLVSPTTTTLERAKNSSTSPELSTRSSKKKMIIQRSVSHATLTQSKPLLTLPSVLPSPSTTSTTSTANNSLATSSTTEKITMSSSGRTGFRKVPEKPKNRRRASTLADAPISVVMSDSFEQIVNTSQSSSVFPHYTSDRQFLLFRCKGLSFDFGLEPFYCTVALYDRSKQVKISEDFKFVLNGQKFEFLHDVTRRCKWMSSTQKKKNPHKDQERTFKALFTQSTAGFDTVLVVRIHKLKVNSEEDSLIYYKQELSNSRVAALTEEYARHFQGLKHIAWQPFAFCIIPVAPFIYHKGTTVPIFAESKYMDDETLFNISAAEDAFPNKAKLIPGELFFSLKPIDSGDLPHYRVDTNSQIVDTHSSAIGEITREIEDFSMLRPPRLDYFCNFYIYPVATLFGKATNIRIQIEIKDDDSSLEAPGLNVIYSDESSGFLDSYTTFSLPSKLPKHYDEIKCKLPPLTEKHHILFTFKQTDKEAKKQNALGYVVVPLYAQGKVLRDREHIYPILKELPTDYLSLYDPDAVRKTKFDIYSQLQLKENKKMMFSFRTKLLSSIIPQEENLCDFFSRSSVITDTFREIVQENKSFRISVGKVSQLKAAVEALPTSLPKETCVTWFPRIFNELFQIMVSFESNREVTGLQNDAFVALIEIIKKLKEQTVVNSETLLMNYINFLFDTDIIDEMTQHRVPLHVCIVEGWLYALKFKEGVFVTFTSHWFLFDLLARSMILHAQKKNGLINDKKKQYFTREFLQQIKEVLLMYCREKWFHTPQFPGIISAIGSFFPKLFRLIHRGTAMKMLFTCVKKMTQFGKEFEKKNPANFARVLDYKWQLLKGAIYKNEDFVPLNMPSLHAASANLDQYVSLKGPKHMLSGLLINELFATLPLRREHSDVQNQAIKLFKSTVLFAENTRLRKKTKEALANTYFMYIVKLSEYVEYISSRQAEMNEWLLCFFHILKMSSKHLLRTWLRREIPAKIFLFLRLISLALFVLQEQQCAEILEEVRHVSAYITMTAMEERKPDLSDTSNPMLSECVRIVFLLLNVHQTKSDIQTSTLLSPRGNRLRREDTISSARSTSKLNFSPHEVDLLTCLFKTIQYISLTYKSAIFENLEDDANSFLQLFCYGLFFYMSVDDVTVNFKAMNCYADLIKINCDVSSDYSKIKLHSIIAMTKLVGDRRIMSAKVLQKSLNSTLEVLDISGDSFKVLDELIQSLTTIALYHNKINREDIEYDHSSLVDFYYNIANGSSDSLDLRVSWLFSISKLHLNNGDFAESGLCKVHMACILGRYLVEQEELALSQYQTLMSYFPAVVHEEDGFLSKGANRFTTSDFWTLAKFLQLMQDAAENFQQGQLYELAVNIYNSLIGILVMQKNYKLVSSMAHLLEKSAEKLSAGENGAARRMFFQYYRVQFFGLKFGEFNGNAYIYKVPESVKLLEFQEYLKKQFSTYSLEFLSNNISEEDAVKFKETKSSSKIRIISVLPYIPPEELDNKSSLFDHHYNINKFTVDLPFTKNGPSNKLSDQCLRRIIYTTEKSFPFIKSRLLVVEREETILNPIQNAKHLIIKQTQYLENITRADTVNRNLLEQLIQGSIAPMVHSGPSEVLAMFLSDSNLANYDVEDMFYLKQAMKEFVVVCEYAIKLHKSMISTAEQEQALHNFFEESLQGLKQKLSSVQEFMLNRAKRTKSRVLDIPLVTNLFKTLETPLYSPEPLPQGLHSSGGKTESSMSDHDLPELSPRSQISRSSDTISSLNNSPTTASSPNMVTSNNNNTNMDLQQDGVTQRQIGNFDAEEDESSIEPKLVRRINKRKTQLNRRIKVFYKTYGTEKGKINSLNSNDFTKRN